MSKWVDDIHDMHEKFGVHEWVENTLRASDHTQLNRFLQFRLEFLQEELNETQEAYENADPEEIIDGLIDLCVIAIGTLDILGVHADQAWQEVHDANMSKVPGVKESRPNPFGLPDLIKPEGWKGPDHRGNHGDTKGFV